MRASCTNKLIIIDLSYQNLQMYPRWGHLLANPHWRSSLFEQNVKSLSQGSPMPNLVHQVWGRRFKYWKVYEDGHQETEQSRFPLWSIDLEFVNIKGKTLKKHSHFIKVIQNISYLEILIYLQGNKVNIIQMRPSHFVIA